MEMLCDVSVTSIPGIIQMYLPQMWCNCVIHFHMSSLVFQRWIHIELRPQSVMPVYDVGIYLHFLGQKFPSKCLGNNDYKNEYYTFKSNGLNTNGKVKILKYTYIYGYSPSYHLNRCKIISSQRFFFINTSSARLISC